MSEVIKTDKPQPVGAVVDTPELRRLVNAYKNECEIVQGHGVPSWRNLVEYISAIAKREVV